MKSLNSTEEIIDALEIKLFALFDDGTEEEVRVDWQPVAFTPRQTEVQLDIDHERLQSELSQRNLLVVTFWGT